MHRCILTGLGPRGRYWHYQIEQHDAVEVAAYVEPSEAARRRGVEELGIDESRIFAQFDEAVGAVEAEFVLDVTPPSIHHEIAAATFAAGLHLLGEKPLSDDFETARRIVTRGREAGLKHMITHNYRFNPLVRTLHTALGDGLIGKVGQCDVQFYKAWADLPGTYYVTEPYMVINDMMVHHFDLMRYLLDADPLWVQSLTWNHSWGWHRGDAAHSIVFGFPDGVHATHVTVACSVGYSPKDYNGAWRFDGPTGSITWSDEKMHHVHKHRVETSVDRPIEATAPPGDIVTEFLAAIHEDREPECDAADHLRSLAMVFAAIRSAEENRRVEINEFD